MGRGIQAESRIIGVRVAVQYFGRGDVARKVNGDGRSRVRLQGGFRWEMGDGGRLVVCDEALSEGSRAIKVR